MKSGNLSRGKASGHGRRSAESSGLTFEPAIGEGIRKLGSTYSGYDSFTLTYSSHCHGAGPSHAETVESSRAQSPARGRRAALGETLNHSPVTDAVVRLTIALRDRRA